LNVAAMLGLKNDPFLTQGGKPGYPYQRTTPPESRPLGFAPDPFRSGPAFQSRDQAVRTTPPPQEAPKGALGSSQQLGLISTVGREPIIPVWYPAENNWNLCIQQMAENYRQIQLEFSGGWSNEERLVQESRLEKAADLLYDESGGRVGSAYQPKTRTARVKDIYQDTAFPPDSHSWYTKHEVPDYTSLSLPKTWRRLQEFVMDVPYPTASPANGNFIPRAGRVYQGILEDFYLVAGMQTVGMKPWLVSQIFADMAFSNPSLGVFTLRLYKHGQWHFVAIDGALPFDQDLNPLCAHSEFWPSFAWPALVEKAYAKLHGSWEALGGGGHVEEVLTDLTGGCSTRFGTQDVAQDRLWQYLYTMQNFCIFGVNTNDNECSKRRIPMEKHYAASIFRVDKHNNVPYVCVCLAAPTFAVARMPYADIPSQEGYGVHDGFVWLRIDDFVQLFDTIFECRLVNSDLGSPAVTGFPYSPGWVLGQPFYEEMWAFQGDVYTETAPSFLMEIDVVPNEITLEVSQTDLRYGAAKDDDETDLERPLQAPLLLRFFQCSPEVNASGGGEIYMVHLSAWGHTRDASTSVKVYQPGKYLAMISLPAQYACHRMIFRSYSTQPLAMKPITQHRSWISVAPAFPLDASPYSLCGFQKIDAVSERLPQMFNESEGRGMPQSNPQLNGQSGSALLAGLDQLEDVMVPGVGRLGDISPWGREDANNPYHLKTVGAFGGRDAVASVKAAEAQETTCSLM